MDTKYLVFPLEIETGVTLVERFGENLRRRDVRMLIVLDGRRLITEGPEPQGCSCYANVIFPLVAFFVFAPPFPVRSATPAISEARVEPEQRNVAAME